VAAIALVTTAWAAPLEDDGTMTARPSRHPERRSVELTVVVAGAGEDVSILREGAGATPRVLRGGVGLVHERLLRCWARRPEAGGRRLSPDGG
jgi:hypothetical protein